MMSTMKTNMQTNVSAADVFPLDHGQLHTILSDKVAALSEWLDENAPQCETDERHMTEGSSERAYWHHGYLTALRDTLAMLEESSD